MENKIKKILIIRLSAIGDTIHTLPLANALKRNFPDAEIHWIVEDKAQIFVKQAKNIDKVYIIPRKKWKKEKNIIKILNEFSFIMNKLKHEKYDIAIDVQQLFKSGLILGFCGAKRKISMNIAREFSNIFANEIIKAKAQLFNPNYHILERNKEYLEYLNIKDDQTTFELKDFSEQTQAKAKSLLGNVNINQPIMVFAPATTWLNKHWSVDNWRKLFEYYAPKANVVFTGTDKDSKLIENITDGFAFPYINLIGQTNLEELAQITKLSDIVISPDSGTAHTAWATEHPYVITIFTSTAIKRTGPIGEKCFSFTSEQPCSPCLKKKCKRKENKNICMSYPTSDTIIKKIDELLFQ